MTGAPSGNSVGRWGPYVVAGILLCCGFLLAARGLTHVRPGADYATWALDHGSYTDILKLSLDHYVRVGHVIHPLPYVHDRIEYPVLLGFALWLPSWLPGGPATWLAAAGLMTAAATFGSIALIRWVHPPSAWWIAASPALLLDAAINWDLVGIVFLIGSVVWFAERRYRISGAAAAVGTFVKLFPVVVAPMAVSALAARRWKSMGERDLFGDATRSGGPTAGSGPTAGAALTRWLLPFAAISAVVMVPFLLTAPSNTLWFFRYNSARGEKDSLWGLLATVLGTPGVASRAAGVGSLLVVMAAMAYGAWAVWRLPSPDHPRGVALATAVAVIAWMAVNKVWNPQYILWVFAAGAIASMPARLGVALGVVAVYDYVFEFVLRIPEHADPYSWVGYGAVVARTAVFAVMAAWSIGQLRRMVAAPEAAPADGLPAPSPS